jgi:tRNA threonylcarbamoyladenosine biosynthesis protein TsaE
MEFTSRTPGITSRVTTRSPEETRALGQTIGELADAGTVLALNGDLGSGKTVFVQGLAKGLGVPADFYVTSPSYTLINEYPGRCVLFHVDLYRVGSLEEIEDIGLFDILHGNRVVAVEWADRIARHLYPDHTRITMAIVDASTRKIDFVPYGHTGNDLLRKLNNRISRHSR